MTRNVTAFQRDIGLLMAAILLTGATGVTADGGPFQQKIDAAARSEQYAFVLFYSQNDAATQKMHGVLKETLSNRNDATAVSVNISDANEATLIEQFDATRMPMPAVAVIAPNGAVTGVYPQQVTTPQLTASIVSSGQAACLKALQDQKIVLLCVHPEGTTSIPKGVQDFQADALFRGRTQLVSVQASDQTEQKFLRQLQVRTDQPSTLTAFMAPPGVMLGVYNAKVTQDVLAQKLAAAGKCCDDPKCKHHKGAAGQSSTRR